MMQESKDCISNIIKATTKSGVGPQCESPSLTRQGIQHHIQHLHSTLRCNKSAFQIMDMDNSKMNLSLSLEYTCNLSSDVS